MILSHIYLQKTARKNHLLHLLLAILYFKTFKYVLMQNMIPTSAPTRTNVYPAAFKSKESL